MSFTKHAIEKTAHLARISVSDAHIEKLKYTLTNILELIEKMNHINTDGIEALAHPFDTSQPLRDDIITETNQRELFQRLAPQVHSGLYIVPQVIDSE